MKKILYLFVAILMFSSCEEQLVMVPEFELPASDRVVLLEELTGVSCPNCPVGTAAIDQIKANYGKAVVAVGIHGSFLSWPTPENKYDFRNEYAAELEEYLRPWQGKPAASINRIKHTDDELSISTPAVWSNYIDAELNKEHVMNLLLTTSYDAETRDLDITVTMIPLKDFSSDDNVHVSVMIVENKIIDAQEDNSTILKEFEHNHVLRTMLTSAKGNPVQQELVENTPINKDFSFTIPLPEEGDLLWVPENIDVIAFTHIVEGDTKDVLQAAEKKIIE